MRGGLDSDVDHVRDEFKSENDMVRESDPERRKEQRRRRRRQTRRIRRRKR